MIRTFRHKGLRQLFTDGKSRGVSAARRLFKKRLRADHRRPPLTTGTDEHASYPGAFAASVKEEVLPADCKLGRVKYLDNVIGQDRGATRGRRRAMQCSRSSHTAGRTPEGFESMHMTRRGQVKGLDGGDTTGRSKFVESLFYVAA